MKGRTQSLSKIVACATLLVSLVSCSGGGSGSDGGGTTQAPLTVTSGTSFPSSPVRIRFRVTNFTIGLPGTPHLRFSIAAIDGGAPHDFYNGAGIGSEGPTSGVRLNDAHTHSVHWTSTTSFTLFALPAGAHEVRLVLVDQNDQELPGTSTTHHFMVDQPQTGDLQLEPVLEGLNFPVGLSLAPDPDGRIFYNERLTGKIRIINPGWQLAQTPFCQVSVETGAEQGLLGLTLDPNFSTNHFVYVYYTVSGGTMNRVARYTESNGVCTNGTTVLNNLPTANEHNGGIIQFGPGGKLYVVIGDAENPANAQILTSLAGKILRVNPDDGSAPADNPFILNPDANAKLVFSLGHRNSYGFTFHPQTNELWESENGRNDNDEINRVVAGGNYGWPTGMGILNQPGLFVDPIAVFFPLPCTICVIAPTGIIAIPGNSSVYEAYRNNLLVAAWIDGTIRLVIPNGTDPDLPGTTSVAYTGGQGGLLSLMLGSDDYIYVSTVNGIFRVLPH